MVFSQQLIRVGALYLLISGAGAGAGAQDSPAPQGPVPAEAVERVELQCIPVGAYWFGQEPGPEAPPGPGLAVVTFDIRPKDAEVHLDGSFIGRSRYFSGKKGHLFLEPGSYVLELRLDGYRVVRIELQSSERCRYELVHRLVRWHGSPLPTSGEDYGKGVPFNRVFAPQRAIASGGNPPTRQGGADLRLRSDLEPEPGSAPVPSVTGASLSLTISPETAAVFVDGGLLATVRELASMEAPAAIPAGDRQIEVRAEGYRTWSETITLEPGEVREMTINLIPDRADDERSFPFNQKPR